MEGRSTSCINFVLFFIFVCHLFLHGGQQVGVYHIKKATANIKIDGYLNEKVWEDALVLPVNIEFMPGENIEAPVQTQCLLLYDDNYLYVGFKADDPHPHRIRAHLWDRDSAWTDDLVAILLDTFNDENRAFAFLCNPLGVQSDEIFSDGGTVEDKSWDAIWDSAGHIHDGGYEVEMAIPFRSLQFQRSTNPQTWGFALLRNYPRSQLHQITNFHHNRNNTCLLCQFPKLAGIEDASPGKNIELDPTFTAFQTDSTENFPDSPMERVDSQMEVGISGQWGFTSNLTLSGAINPDFSQVEADVA
ncbi:MAG: carbohydrate binding family 9 domain-containing protein, partial [Candidatus Aminicenantes bacterium]